VAACDKFVYLDVLRSSEEPERLSEKATAPTAPTAPARKSPGQLRNDPKLLKLLREGINAASDDDGWANLSGVGSYVAKQQPDFDSRNWGYAKLIDLVTAIGLFEVKRAAGQGVRVREKPKGQVAKKAAAKKSATKKSAARTP
jgi:hypothetical protein